MFIIDDKEIRKLEKQLKKLSMVAYAMATRSTINSAAFDARKQAIKLFKKEFIQRNRFTSKSVLVDPSKTLKVSNQSAFVGSTADYMKRQEFGGTIRKKGKEGIPIPTSFAAGQEGARPRTKLPTRPNKLTNINLRQGKRKPVTRKQAILFAAQDAVTSGKRYVFIDFGGGSKGIVKIKGGRKKFKKGWPTGAQIKMTHNLSAGSVRIPRNAWLQPSMIKSAKKLPVLFKEKLIFQLKRRGMFKG